MPMSNLQNDIHLENLIEQREEVRSKLQDANDHKTYVRLFDEWQMLSQQIRDELQMEKEWEKNFLQEKPIKKIDCAEVEDYKQDFFAQERINYEATHNRGCI